MHKFLAVVVFVASVMSSYAQAGLVTTHDYIHSPEGDYYSKQQLQAALASEELQQQLVDMGVDPVQVAERIASLTSAEIQQLNSALAEQPAGGIVGVILTVFIVFIITDMLCATDIFSFVKCINK